MTDGKNNGERTAVSEATEDVEWEEFADKPTQEELDNPKLITIGKIAWHSSCSVLRDRPGQIMGLAFLVLMAWGTHGKLELFRYLWPAWRKFDDDPTTRPDLIPGMGWDYEVISFWVGALLVVVIPILVITFWFKQKLSDYGLGRVPKKRRRLGVLTFLTLTPLFMPFFYIGAHDAEMQSVYPLYRGEFSGLGDFFLYELCYLPFFVVIEFIFRGFLLFGLAGARDKDVHGAGGGVPGPFYFRKFALVIQMLAYTAWHLGKPLAELWGTPIWGLGAGALAYSCRSIWPIVFAHWVLNIWVDAVALGYI